MLTFRYAKLVRDNIQQMHEDNGDVVTGKILSQRELTDALQQKLIEETAELFDAVSIHNIEHIQNELADIYQVLQDLAATLDISEAAIETARTTKFKKKGGFKKGVYIETVNIVHEDDPLIEGFRENPTKYPELTDS